MRRERVSDDIYIFTSALYAQVTASAIVTEDGAIVIDTLPFPTESREMADFVHRRHPLGARYVVNTHYHADHIYGNYLYPEARLIGHRLCRAAILSIDVEQLERAKLETPALEEVTLHAPTIIFDDEMGLHLGARSLRLMRLPGHSEDGIGLYVEGDKILFAGDAVLPVPYFGAGGSPSQLRRTLRSIIQLAPEHIVQGHGETLLRGEISETLERHLAYLDCIEARVGELLDDGLPAAALQGISIEECGLSPIPLDGLVRRLHHTNLLFLYQQGKLAADARDPWE